jgi:hypothetical protein
MRPVRYAEVVDGVHIDDDGHARRPLRTARAKMSKVSQMDIEDLRLATDGYSAAASTLVAPVSM